MQGTRARVIAERTMRLEPFDLPDAPGEGQVLVRTERTIVSAGTELANYTGLEPDTRRPGGWCYYPWTPGYGGLGRVLRVGPRVAGITEGDRVYGMLNHATHAVIDTRDSLCVKVPAELDPTLAVTARMACVSITALHRATLLPDDAVAVIGLGLVGNLAGQFFALQGHRTVGVDPAEHRRDLAVECGFAVALPADAPDLGDALAKAAGGRPPRVVVEAVGRSDLVEQAVGLVAAWGQVILLGSPRAPYSTEVTPMLSDIHKRAIEVRGALEHIYPRFKRQSPTISVERNVEFIFACLRDGRLKVKDLITHVVRPQELDDAYRGLLDRKDEYLGVVVDWDA